MNAWHTLAQHLVFDHPWERIFLERVRTAQGLEIDYLASYPNDFVMVVPFLSARTVLLLSQYKHGIQKTVTTFPAGFLEAEEEPLAAAKRELLEETGYDAERWEHIATLSENPTRCRNRYYVFFAYHCTQRQNILSNPDTAEGTLEPITITLKELCSPPFLRTLHSGPMLSVLPFLFQKIR